jgi:uncharacterized RDD family membrane protein YckC
MSKTIKILTPENVEIEYSLASVGVRAAAAGIDFLIHLVVLFIAGGIAIGIIYHFGASDEVLYTAIAIILIIYGLLNYAYFVICDMFMKGQTFGKKVYHIRIIRDNGEGIAFSHAMIREFFRAAIDPLGVGFITMFFSKRNKRLGDMLASTIVVEEEKKNLSLLDITNKTLSQYQLTKEEMALLRDYFDRIETLREDIKKELENKFISYFTKQFDIQDPVTDKEQFLRSLLQ